ncbi:acyl dehydratase [Streptomyces sp. OE57]|uniref:acyl dehydratase n=1 Tax=Streptomyces lacaronensis TaxID=3379885 RepID=UPI0039B788E7
MTAPAVGAECPPRRYAHTSVQLFRFSAVSWNAHRIHYDAAYAATEGFPDAVVQSTLHGEMLTRHALEWAGPGARLESVAWRNVATAVAGERLTWAATVSSVEGARIRLDARILKADGSECVTGTVEVTRAG